MKSWQSVAVLGVCLAVVLAAMGWISVTVLRLDRAQAEAERQAVQEENTRLALWRMDAAMASLLARENARPYFHYSSFYPAERAYSRMYRDLGVDEVILPSPLLNLPTPQVLLHFQIEPDGSVRSPQVPEGRMLELAESTYGIAGKIRDSASMLGEIRGKLVQAGLTRASLLARREAPSRPAPATDAEIADQSPAQQARVPPARQQAARNAKEWNVRLSQQIEEERQVRLANAAPPAAPAKIAADGAAAVGEGVMRPAWAGGALLLTRQVTVDGRSYVQGCWLDWPAIRKGLLAQVADLFDRAELEPANEPGPGGRRMLASLPVRLAPGTALNLPVPATSPVRLSLVVAWMCVVLAAVAFGVLLAGVVALSERRATFVSSVTHELRTPLTTFRLYTEMLAENMVADESKRREYLRTMGAEASRLAHLVENVLAYSRIERGRAIGRMETTTVGALLDSLRERLAQRASQAGMELLIDGSAEAMGRSLSTDRSAVDQILFNLVDNACKYAASATDRRIHIDAESADSQVILRVRDHGPGVSPADQRRLFRAFSKSAQRAANSAPGIGLGLALSRRLAGQLGGALTYAPVPGNGAAFELSLRA